MRWPASVFSPCRLTRWITRWLLGLQSRRPSFDRSADIGGAPLDLRARFVDGFRAAVLSSTAAPLLSAASLARRKSLQPSSLFTHSFGFRLITHPGVPSFPRSLLQAGLGSAVLQIGHRSLSRMRWITTMCRLLMCKPLRQFPGNRLVATGNPASEDNQAGLRACAWAAERTSACAGGCR
jgi:hypothetical protein